MHSNVLWVVRLLCFVQRGCFPLDALSFFREGGKNGNLIFLFCVGGGESEGTLVSLKRRDFSLFFS